MSWFGFGGGSKVDKHVKKLTNAYAQTHDRIRSLELLSDIGTDEALYGICQRFTYRTEASIVDEDEKELAYKFLVAAGPSVIAPIKRFVAEKEAVYWPIKALRDVAGMDSAVEVLLDILENAEDFTGRVNEKKHQVVSNLRDFQHPKVLAKLKQLVADRDEEVRIMAMDGLMTYGEDEAKPHAARLLLDSEESPRVKMVLLEQLIEQGWSLADWREQFEEQDLLPFPYRVGASGVCERVS